jgi:hypothetical protein
MHLSGKSYAGDLIGLQVCGGEGFADGDSSGSPPILRVLLGPADLGRSEGLVFFGSGRGNLPIGTNNERSRSASTDVNTE